MAQELSDAEVFGTQQPQEMSDEEVFGTSQPSGYFSDVGKDLKSAYSGLDNLQSPAGGGQAALEDVNQVLGSAGKAVGSPILQGISHGASALSPLVPQGVKDTVSNARNALSNKVIGAALDEDNNGNASDGTQFKPLQDTGEYLKDVTEDPNFQKHFANTQDATNLLMAKPTINFAKNSQAAIKDVGSEIASEMTHTPPPTVDRNVLNKTAQDLYDISDKTGGAFKPEVHNGFIDYANNITKQPDTILRNQGLDAPAQYALNLKNSYGLNLPLKDAIAIDQDLTDKIWSNTEQNGKVNSDGRKYSMIQSKLRDMMNNANENDIIGGKDGIDSYRAATGVYAAKSKLDLLDKIMRDASLADNPSAAMKSGLTRLARSDKKMTGFTDDEKLLIQDAARNGITDKFLKFLSGNVSPMVGGAMGLTLAGEQGVAVGAGAGKAVQAVADKALSSRRQNKFNSISNAIANRPVIKNAPDILANAQNNYEALKSVQQPVNSQPIYNPYYFPASWKK